MAHDQAYIIQKIQQRLSQIDSISIGLADWVSLLDLDPGSVESSGLYAQLKTDLETSIKTLQAIIEVIDLRLARDAAARNESHTEQQSTSSETVSDAITTKESHEKGTHAESRPSGSHGSKSKKKERQHGSKKKTP